MAREVFFGVGTIRDNCSDPDTRVGARVYLVGKTPTRNTYLAVLDGNHPRLKTIEGEALIDIEEVDFPQWCNDRPLGTHSSEHLSQVMHMAIVYGYYRQCFRVYGPFAIKVRLDKRKVVVLKPVSSFEFRVASLAGDGLPNKDWRQEQLGRKTDMTYLRGTVFEHGTIEELDEVEILTSGSASVRSLGHKNPLNQHRQILVERFLTALENRHGELETFVQRIPTIVEANKRLIPKEIKKGGKTRQKIVEEVVAAGEKYQLHHRAQELLEDFERYQEEVVSLLQSMTFEKD